MAVKMIFHSRKDDLNIYAENEADANKAIREYLGISYGGLTESELANADEWYTKPYDGERREVVELRKIEIPEYAGGGVTYETLSKSPIEKYL